MKEYKKQEFSKATVVKLVTDITTVDCDVSLLDDCNRLVYHDYSEVPFFSDRHIGLPHERVPPEIVRHCVPVHRVWHGYSTPEKDITNEYYIAYTPKIRDLFQLPVESMQNTIDRLTKENQEVQKTINLLEYNERILKHDKGWYEAMYTKTDKACVDLCSSFWKRLKFLFTGKAYIAKISELPCWGQE